MRYHGKRGPRKYEKRRYLGEDEITRNHWPQTGPNGEQSGLIAEMETIKPEDYGIEIINCTPDSAMECFPIGDIYDELALSH